MKSTKHGKNILEVEVTSISKHGIWVYVHEKEYFLPFESFPWFIEAKISDIYNVKLLHPDHLYWDSLDIDLSIDQLVAPEKYPLIYTTA